MPADKSSSSQAEMTQNKNSSSAISAEARINIEVAYATPAAQQIIAISIPANDTVEEAIKASGILTEFPEIDLKVNKVGIFGKLTKLDNSLQEKDRIEIYRKLIADPKVVRKQRAAEGKKMKKGGGSV